MFDSVIRNLDISRELHYFPAGTFPTINPVHWLTSHFAVGGFSPLQRLSGMLTAHMTQIAPYNGFTWHPHRGLEIFTYVIDGSLYHEDSTGGKGVIRAGEVQRMFSGHYIEHQELNRTDTLARVIQIWFIADVAHMGIPPHYEQTSLDEMNSRLVGDAVVRDIIGPQGATHAHVTARLSSAIVPAGGSTQVELPNPGEDLFLYFVDGRGEMATAGEQRAISTYDVLLASPAADPVTVVAGNRPLNFLSFYLRPFMRTRQPAI